MFETSCIRVLLIEDNLGDARLAELALAEVAAVSFEVARAQSLSAALQRLDEDSFDVALLDLSLPDADGLEALERLRRERQGLPIVVLTGLNNDTVSLDAVQKGAEDYLLKGQDTGETIARSIRYAIERRRGHQLLLEAKDKAELANRAKSEFLATMSHELRTPLNAIIGFSDVMKREIFGPIGHVTYSEYANDIHESGQHLLGIINDILDLAKIEAGSAELHEEAVGIQQTYEVSTRMVAQRAEAAGVTLRAEIADRLPPIWADKLKLQQVLANLLSNAVKFTAAGGTVVFTAGLDEDGDMVLVVADSGIGMAPGDIPKALSPFEQIDSSLSREYAGTGLGLPLAKRLVELHGGTIVIDSEVGEGTSVTVRFSKSRCMPAAPDGVPGPLKPPGTAQPPARGRAQPAGV